MSIGQLTSDGKSFLQGSAEFGLAARQPLAGSVPLNPKYFGDSYDLVKRFFCSELRRMNFHVSIDPMLTGDWSGAVDQFYLLLGIESNSPHSLAVGRNALFVDPDTGISSKASSRHVTYEQLATQAGTYDLVFAFDQAFSRREKPAEGIRRKIALLNELGRSAMFYDSHARFLFLARQDAVLVELKKHCCELGVPQGRFVCQ